MIVDNDRCEPRSLAEVQRDLIAYAVHGVVTGSADPVAASELIVMVANWS